MKIAVAKGDGIGPEIMEAVLSVFQANKVPLSYEYVDMGKWVFDKGFSNGMTPDAKTTIENLGILFKGPMETPKGKGVKSVNVTARKTWNTYANKRVFQTLHGVDTVFSKAGIPIDMRDFQALALVHAAGPLTGEGDLGHVLTPVGGRGGEDIRTHPSI